MGTGLHSSCALWMAMAPIAALAAAVGLALVVKVRAAKDEVGGIADQLRPRAWRILAGCAVIQVGPTAWWIYDGLVPPVAVLVGLVGTLGCFVAAAGVLRMERILIETGAEAKARQRSGRPPQSTALSRVVALVIGGAIVVGEAVFVLLVG